MMVTGDQLIQIGLLLCGFAAIMLPFHQQNVARSRASAERQMEQAELLDRVWKKLKKHDKRVRSVDTRLATIEKERARVAAQERK
jgi:Flp pilus assembly protein TadB